MTAEDRSPYQGLMIMLIGIGMIVFSGVFSSVFARLGFLLIGSIGAIVGLGLLGQARADSRKRSQTEDRND